MIRPFCREVLDCASALALSDGHGASESGGAPPQSKTLTRGSWPRCAIGESWKLPMILLVLVDKAAEELYPIWEKNQEQWKLAGGEHAYHYFGSASCSRASVARWLKR
jgi:hypothetical protein